MRTSFSLGAKAPAVWITLCALIPFLISASQPAANATLTGLHSATNKFADGAYPVGKLALVSGNLYGFTQYGVAGSGSFIKMTPAGAVTSTELSTVTNGPVQPNAGPILGVSGTTLYATSRLGGDNGGGTVFSVTLGGAVTVLHSFGAGTDGLYPASTLLLGSDHMLYGTTSYGGTPNQGTIFRINTNGTGYQVLRELDNTVDQVNYPFGGLAESNGRIYGTSYYTVSGNGGIYSLPMNGGVTTLDAQFTTAGPEGYDPLCDLVRATDGNLYGTNLYGGAHNHGTIFRLNPATDTISTVWAFDGYTGDTPGFNVNTSPQCRLTQGTDGKLYGVARFGGLYGYGTVFKADPVTNTCSLVTSQGLTSGDASANPLTQNGTTLYFTSYYSGTTAVAGPGGTSDGYGAAMSCTTTGTFKLIHSFYIDDAYYPADAPVGPIGGYYYGTMYSGGQYAGGAIYKVSPTGAYSIVHSFTNLNLEGYYPYGRLCKAADGALYGCTTGGGYYGGGTIYKFTTAGALTVIHQFRGTIEGYYCQRGLTQGVGTDKNLYGVCTDGSPINFGTAFRTDTAGKAFQVIHYFSGDDGIYPDCMLTPDANGGTTTAFLYGMTYSGGANSFGTLFRVSATGNSFSNLRNLDSASGVWGYYSGPIVVSGGALYGSLYAGGVNNGGTIFKYVLGTNTYSVLHEFEDDTIVHEGLFPTGGLVTDGSGFLYGTCYSGGNLSYGVVYKVNMATGALQVLHHFGGLALGDGSGPYGGVTYDSATGMLAGTTNYGGASDVGFVFKQTLTP